MNHVRVEYRIRTEDKAAENRINQVHDILERKEDGNNPSRPYRVLVQLVQAFFRRMKGRNLELSAGRRKMDPSQRNRAKGLVISSHQKNSSVQITFE